MARRTKRLPSSFLMLASVGTAIGLVLICVSRPSSGVRAETNFSTPAGSLRDAYRAKPDRYAGKTEMNGHTLREFGDFWQTWKLVTVRFRQDTGEIRFTYANELAWKSLNSGTKDYPNGSIFAKIGFISEKDPNFISSSIPSGAKRYQFMVRDQEHFGETDGWAYALFNGEGRTFNGDPKSNAIACAACHRIVSGRGYVFSQPVPFAPFLEKAVKVQAPAMLSGAPNAVIHFETRELSSLPPAIARFLPGAATHFRSLEGPLKKNIFDGTLNEIGPTLAKESLGAGVPSALVSEDGLFFAFTYPDPSRQAVCADGKKRIVFGRSILSNTVNSGQDADQVLVKMLSYCAGG